MKRTNVEVSKKELAGKVEAVVQDMVMSKSAKVRELFDLGLEVKAIGELLGIRYNFAYNVIQNYVLTQGIEVEASAKSTKKDAVWALFDSGKSLKEVSAELKMNYNHVWKLQKEWKLAAEAEVQAAEQEEQTEEVVAEGAK